MSLKADLAKARRRYRDYRQKRHDAKPGGDRRKKLAKLVRFWRDRKDRLAARLDRRRHRKPNYGYSYGTPHWGGCEDILKHEVVPIYIKRGVPVTSGKRWATYGNPGSDHYMGVTYASARDAGTANNYSLRNEVMRALGVHSVIVDYGSYYVYRDGHRFRVQPIAGTHGTGPHLHIGIRRA